MNIAPCTVKRAIKLVAQWHRHLPRLHGALFAAALDVNGVTVGVAVAGVPCQEWNGTGRIVISRVAVEAGVHNGCSMLYGAMCQAAKALGWSEAWTYTLPEEPGTSLRAAGFRDNGNDGRGRAFPRQ